MKLKKLNLKKMRESTKRLTKKVGVKLKKKTPDILFVAGVGAGIASLGLAIKGTYEGKEEIDRKLEVITEIKNFRKEYPDADYSTDLCARYKDLGKTLGKYYGACVIAEGVSIACHAKSNTSLKANAASWAAAYMALSQERKVLRDKIDTTEGKEERIKVLKERNVHTPYSRIFDENSSEFDKGSHQYNLEYLYDTEKHFNTVLNVRGYVFLNEVLLYMDIPTIDEPYAEFLGWIKQEGEDAVAEKHIDFGIWDSTKEGSRNFVNGHEEAVWLDFNIDGDISDELALSAEDFDLLDMGNRWLPHHYDIYPPLDQLKK